MTHIGKIGRLPKAIRDELGVRLEDGLPGSEIVQWLNSLADVQDVLQRYFQGRAITEQNLSEWRQAGHQDWLRRQDASDTARNFLESAQDLEELAGERGLSTRFASIFAVELTRLAMALLEPETDPEKKWQRLCEIHRELSRLRRDDDRAARTLIEQERWQYEFDRAEAREAERLKAADRQQMINKITGLAAKPVHAECFGGGAHGRRVAEFLYRVQNDMPVDDLLDPEPETPAPAVPAETEAAPGEVPVVDPGNAPVNSEESRRIQPDPTKNDENFSKTIDLPLAG
jgi:hypothetical protein